MADVTEVSVSSGGSKLHELEDRYAPEAERPLAGYLAALGTFAAASGSLAAVVHRRGGPPDRVHERDIVLGSVASFHLARLLGLASVTSPLRAAFTRYAGSGAPGETHEEVQQAEGGLRHTIGELVSCPYCLGTWTAMLTGFGLVLAPRWTRFAATVLAIDACGHALQKLYSDLQAR